MAFRAAGFRGWLVLGVLLAVASSSGCGKSTSQSPHVVRGGEAGVGGELPGEGGHAPGAGSASFPGGSDASEGGGDASEGSGDASEGGAPVSGGETSSGRGGAPFEPAPPGLVLRAITISQTHELPLMRAGAEVIPANRPAPLIANKQALVRAFIDVQPGFVERSLLGVLDVKTPTVTRTLLSERLVTQSSRQDDLATSFVFHIEAADVTPDSAYRLRVLEEDTTPLARYPEDGYFELGARALPPFELVVVPFVTNGFAPRMGESDTNSLRRRLLALFPSSEISITVATPVTLPYVVSDDGAGWEDALDRIYDLRADAAPNHDVFYYGAMAPGASFADYCVSDCILGSSRVAEESDVESRGSIGITLFQDGSGSKDAWDTLAHELGHALGREHAPCNIPDPNDTDSNYPYPNGGLGGTYGYDFELSRLVKPKPAKDVMGYCTPVWISDYTYRALYERLDYIASESFRALAFAPPPLFRLARIRQNGESAWLGEQRRRGIARGIRLDLLGTNGQPVRTIEAQEVAVDHPRGAYVWLPVQTLTEPSAATSVDLRPLGGSVLPL